jgi:glutaredoxin
MYVIVTRNQCSFCDTAKAILKSAKLQYTEYNVQSPSSKWILTLIKKANMTTVPQIFAPDGTHIGGYTELKEHIINEYS